jgi:hypothetical protein
VIRRPCLASVLGRGRKDSNVSASHRG